MCTLQTMRREPRILLIRRVEHLYDSPAVIAYRHIQQLTGPHLPHAIAHTTAIMQPPTPDDPLHLLATPPHTTGRQPSRQLCRTPLDHMCPRLSLMLLDQTGQIQRHVTSRTNPGTHPRRNRDTLTTIRTRNHDDMGIPLRGHHIQLDQQSPQIKHTVGHSLCARQQVAVTDRLTV